MDQPEARDSTNQIARGSFDESPADYAKPDRPPGDAPPRATPSSFPGSHRREESADRPRLLKRVESRQRGRSQSREARRSGAATESRIIHSPYFDRAAIPHFRFLRHPALRAIRIAIETQDEKLRALLLLRTPGSSTPDFQLSASKRNALCAARLPRRCARCSGRESIDLAMTEGRSPRSTNPTQRALQ